MRRWLPWIWLLLLWTVGCGRVPEDGYAEAVVTAEVQVDADEVRVREAWSWQRGHGPPSRQLELEWLDDAFALRPVWSLQSAKLDGVAFEPRVRRYDDWIDIDLPQTEAGPRHRLDLEYTLRGAWREREGGQFALPMTQVSSDSPLHVKSVSVLVVGPSTLEPTLWATHDYTEFERVPLEVGESAGQTSWTARLGASNPGDPLFWRLRVGAALEPETVAYLPTLIEQSGIVPIASLVALVFGVVLRLLPAYRTISGMRFLHLGVFLVAGWEIVGLQLAYWWPEALQRGADLDEAFMEVAASTGLLALLGVFLLEQDRGMRRRVPEAFVLEPAMPIALAVALPMLPIRASYLVLPLLGLPGLIAWLRRPVALAMGADLHRLVDAVQTRGTTTVNELATDLRLRPADVRALLERHGNLPIVFERDQDRVLASSAAALQADLHVCPSCGGGTRIAGQDLVDCPYCTRSYASSRTVDPQPPVPLVVRTINALLETLGDGLVGWAVLLSLAFVTMSFFDDEDGTFIAAIIVAALFLGLTAWIRGRLESFAKHLVTGERYGFLVALLVVTSPLVLPLVALSKVLGPRVRLHFGRQTVEGLATQLESRGQLSIDDLARLLRTRWDEAFDLAVYLCGSGGLDAALDRQGLRLIARSRLRGLAKNGTCQQCGGILGVLDGTTRCHYCGEAAE